MPGMIEHCTSAHRELQCFQMRENSVFWTCPTPNQTKMKNPWKSQAFTPKYIICPMCKFEIPKKVFITHPTVDVIFTPYVISLLCNQWPLPDVGTEQLESLHGQSIWQHILLVSGGVGLYSVYHRVNAWKKQSW